VVLVHPEDIPALGLAPGDTVDLISEWQDGVERVAERFRVVPYPTARGCAAAYYPETNPLVPLGSVAEKSNTPASKSVVIRLRRRKTGDGTADGDPVGDAVAAGGPAGTGSGSGPQ
jgi:anaerobic selenocysteine-containing dehydrogenase